MGSFRIGRVTGQDPENLLSDWLRALKYNKKQQEAVLHPSTGTLVVSAKIETKQENVTQCNISVEMLTGYRPTIWLRIFGFIIN